MNFFISIDLIPPVALGSVGFLLAAAWQVRVLSDHASKHGGEEIEARTCLEQHAEWQIWREPNQRYHRLCRTENGMIYDQIVEWDGRQWVEITAFKPNPWGRGNHWNNIRIWLERKGATPYKGEVPPKA